MSAVDKAAEVLDQHEVIFISYQDGWDCGCNERGTLPAMPFRSDAMKHQAEAVVAAVTPLIGANAWDEGYAAGYDHAPLDRYSEEDPEPLPNPYHKDATDD